jgi:NAD(P)-dependent dehydrogenase (short-subunit alcohol dehydrogenase family)
MVKRSRFVRRVAVVTGAASGIGHALCVALRRDGATVYAADLNAEGLKLLQQECGATPVELNVADEAAVKALLDRVQAAHGRLDYLFNNAGIVVGGPTEGMDSQVWRKIVDVNLWGVIHGSQHGYALMRAQGHGHIVNTSSTAGVAPLAKSVAYATTKHAVVGLSTSLRAEGRRHGVNVSVAIPGMVDTGIFDAATNVQGYDYRAAMRKVPIRKITPQQAADALLRGVVRNRQYIVFPANNRVIVTLHRLLPGPMSRLINMQRGTP